MKNLFYIFLIFTTVSLITSCDKDDDPVVVMGCMDSLATNYNLNATEADPNNPCVYPANVGCMDDTATNYDPDAEEPCDDCCEYPPNVGCMDNTATNYDPDATESCKDCCEYAVMPDSYVFMREGLSTVDYPGQICRVNQAVQLMDTEFKNPANTASSLNDMIQNGFAISVCTSQKIGDKIAAADGYDEVGGAIFQGWMTDIVNDLATNVFPTWDSPASVGVAGVIDGRHVNAHGLEPNQAFTKGLIGAMCLDQITNKYTQPAYISGQDNTPTMGGGYTDMEHKWDEGFVYLFGMDQLANVSGLSYSASGDVLLLKYAYKIGDDIVEDLYDLFIEGRHAIVIGDYATRDAASLEIKSILDGIVMQKAVDYLRGGAQGLTDAMNCVEDDAGASTVAQGFDPSFSGGCAEAVPYFINAGYTCDTDLGVLGIPGISGTITDMCGCSCNYDYAWADILHDLSEGYGFVLSLQFTDAFNHDDVVSMKATLDNDGGNGFWDIDPAALTEMADMIEAAM